MTTSTLDSKLNLNVGTIDGVVRAILGLALIVYSMQHTTDSGEAMIYGLLIGAGLTLTGIIRWCCLYAVLRTVAEKLHLVAPLKSATA